MKPRIKIRVIAGFVCAPIEVGVITFLSYLLLRQAGALVFDIALTTHPLTFAVWLSIGAAVVGVLLTCLVAIPLFLWMVRRGRLSLGRVSLAGAAIGIGSYLATIVAILLADTRPRAVTRNLNQLFENAPRMVALSAFLGAIGMITAATFWLIAIRGSELDPAGSRS
jgi:hypothetical protein